MKAHELTDALLAAATTDAVVRVDVVRNLNVRWANSTTTTNGSSTLTNLAIGAIVDGRVGSLSCTLSGGEDPVALMRAAEEAAATKPPSEDALPLVTGDGSAPADWAAEAADAEPGLFGPLTGSLSRMFASARASGDPTYGYAEHVETTTWLGTSSGIRKRGAVGHGQLAFTTKDPTRSRSAWDGEWVSDWDRVDPVSTYEGMRRRLEVAKERIDMPAGRYEVILTPSCLGDMLTYFTWLATLRDALDGQSAFSKAGGGTRVGERLTDAAITISSDPSAPGLAGLPFVATTSGSTASTSIFDAGIDVGRTDLVRDGVLVNLIAPRAIAQRAGVEPIQGPRNILMAGDGKSLDDMIASTGRALLLNSLWYIRLVDPRSMLLTGLTRDGVYLVEDGEMRGAVNNFRFNVSPLDMLSNVTEVGASANTLPREFEMVLAAVPPVRVSDWNMSSVSDAT
jgi:predicted Zn-dependent protease